MADSSLFEDWGARFSSCGTYRYLLWRIWDAAKPLLLFIMLNPSTADASANDPTVERCQRRARAGGYGGLLVVNIFAFRSTDPAALYSAADPIGPENDQAIIEAAGRAALIVCGWGTHGALNGRGQAVLANLAAAGFTANALKLNADGSPQHPLYVSYTVQPTPVPIARSAENFV